MTEHAVGTQEEWQAERDKLLAEEKASSDDATREQAFARIQEIGAEDAGFGVLAADPGAGVDFMLRPTQDPGDDFWINQLNTGASDRNNMRASCMTSMVSERPRGDSVFASSNTSCRGWRTSGCPSRRRTSSSRRGRAGRPSRPRWSSSGRAGRC